MLLRIPPISETRPVSADPQLETLVLCRWTPTRTATPSAVSVCCLLIRPSTSVRVDSASRRGPLASPQPHPPRHLHSPRPGSALHSVNALTIETECSGKNSSWTLDVNCSSNPQWAEMRRSAADSCFAHPPSQLTTSTARTDSRWQTTTALAAGEDPRLRRTAGQPGPANLGVSTSTRRLMDQSTGHSNKMIASPALYVHSLGQHERAVVIVVVHGLAG